MSHTTGHSLNTNLMDLVIGRSVVTTGFVDEDAVVRPVGLQLSAGRTVVGLGDSLLSAAMNVDLVVRGMVIRISVL